MAPATDVTLYVTPVAPLQTEAEPVIAPAAEGTVLIVIAVLLAVPLPQVLVGVTLTLPAVEPKVTVIPVVPAPAVIEAPAGTVHV